jgi:hypothetical protein
MVLRHQAHTVAHFTFNISGTVFRSTHFPLDLIPSLRYNMTIRVIFEITAFFDNLTRAQLLAIADGWVRPNKTKAKNLCPAFCCRRRHRPDNALTPMFRIFCL